MAPKVRTGGSATTGQAAPPPRNIHVNSIVNTKLPRTPKEKAPTYSGMPVEAYSKIFIDTIRSFEASFGVFPTKIKMRLDRVSLSDCTDDRKAEAYLNVCNFTGGILGFFNDLTIDVDGQLLEFEYDDLCTDPFDFINYDDSLSSKIKSTGKWGDPCKIHFVITATNDNASHKYEFKWVFSPYAPWLNAFSYLTDVLYSKGNTYVLPTLVSCLNIQDYLDCESEDEFYALLQQFRGQALYTEHRAAIRQYFSNQINALFDLVCNDFKNFAARLTQNGFFNAGNELRKLVKSYTELELKISFVEKVKYEHSLPQGVISHIADIRKEMPEHAVLDESEGKIIFYALPTAAEQKALKNVFHLNHSAKKNMDDEQKYKYKMLDQVWRPKLDNLFASGIVQKARQETIIIKPQFAELEKTEAAVEKYTHAVLDAAEEYTVYTLPIDISEYRKALKSPKVISRLLNYGEKYFEEDADKWGDYHAGIIPASQSEINSAQRLMKLISVHASRLQIKWNSGKAICPICGSTDCKKESKNNWQCRNPECGVIFGITKHADGCGASYEWTRPFVDIRKRDIPISGYMDLMLRKEIIFDRLAITDFELEEQADGCIKYIPICPKCGKRVGHK